MRPLAHGSVLLLSVAMVATACGTAATPSATPGGSAATAPAGATSTPDFSGQEITILGNRVGPTAEQFRNAVAPFEELTGAEVLYEETSDFNTTVTTRVEGGSPPDIIIFPQPGFLADIADAGHLRSLNEVIDVGALEESLIPGMLELGTVDGTVYGVPYRVNLKSLVWYNLPTFEAAGYEPPETWDELIELSDQILADGTAPWCIGIEIGGGTGWVATDWIEDIMLRTAGPEKYDEWTAGELPFDSPEVRRAWEMFAEIAFTDGYVLGGRPAIVSTSLLTAGNPLFEDPPGCYLHKQGDFFVEFLPEGVEMGTDLAFFQFPEVDPEWGNPILGGGEFVTLLTDNPAAAELVRWLATPEGGAEDAAAGGFLSPHRTFDPSNYPDEPTRQMAEIVASASAFRFDGGDLMPDVVQAGTWWPTVTDWIAGTKDLDTALAEIDAAWPEE